MSDKLKPVRCGCGGEAQYEAYENYNFGSYIAHIMICDKCGMRTAEWPSEAEAITVWNRAMGATDMNVGDKERTAKVIDKSVGRHSISDFDWIGKCEKCGNEIQYSFDFCPYCGAKLDWSEE